MALHLTRGGKGEKDILEDLLAKTRKVCTTRKRTLGTLEGIIYTFFLLDLIYDIFSGVHSTGNL